MRPSISTRYAMCSLRRHLRRTILAILGIGLGSAIAVVSGAVASGLGYFVWYAALRGLTTIRAATVQLSVPVIAAFGGVLLLGESLTLRLIVAALATLGGVAIVLSQKAAPRTQSD